MDPEVDPKASPETDLEANLYLIEVVLEVLEILEVLDFSQRYMLSK